MIFIKSYVSIFNYCKTSSQFFLSLSHRFCYEIVKMVTKLGLKNWVLYKILERKVRQILNKNMNNFYSNQWYNFKSNYEFR